MKSVKRACWPLTGLFSKSFNERFINLLEKTTLSDKDKRICKDMYIQRISHMQTEYRNLFILHFILTMAVNVGSVVVPCFTALQKLSLVDDTAGIVFYWLTLALSVTTMVANKTLYVFNINKRYFTIKETLRRHYNEGWQFLTRVVKYRKCKNDIEAYKLFCTRLAKMEERSIELMPTVEHPVGENNGAQQPQLARNDSSDVAIEPLTPQSSSFIQHNVTTDPANNV